MPEKMKKQISITFIAMLLFFSYGCQKKQAVVTEQEIPVRVKEVHLTTIKETIDYVGDISAQDEALVYPKVNGKIIEKIKEEGQPVKKGDIIAFVDRDEVGFKFEKAPVESPLEGIVGRVYVDLGTSVTPQTAVALVVDMEKVEIELDVPEKYLPRVRLGQKAQINVDAYPGENFTGSVSKLSPVVDLATRSAPVEISIDNRDHRLKSGMLAKVHLILSERDNVPVVIKEAILGKEPNVYVYTAQDNKAILKKISLGIRQAAYFEVKDGLKEGDLVVVMGQQRLYDGALLSVEQENE